MEDKEKKKFKITPKQVVAMSGVVILVLLYIVTLILALVDNSASHKFFALSLAGTLIIPIVVFIYAWMYARITGQKTIGDPDETVKDIRDNETEA